MIRACDRQVRIAPRGVFGLDFAAIFAVAQAWGAPLALLADLLPEIEPLVVAHYRPED